MSSPNPGKSGKDWWSGREKKDASDPQRWEKGARATKGWAVGKLRLSLRGDSKGQEGSDAQ